MPCLKLLQRGLGQSPFTPPLYWEALRAYSQSPEGGGKSSLLRDQELALGNRILHSTADPTEATGRGSPFPEKGAAGASPRVASVLLGPAKSSFPPPPPFHSVSPRLLAASAASAPTILLKMPGPFSFVQQDSVALPSTHMLPMQSPVCGCPLAPAVLSSQRA